MDQLFQDLMLDIKKKNGGHILYHYKDEQIYIDNTVSFIIKAIKSGNHVLLLENERNFNIIETVLKQRLTDTEYKKLHYINNFDFYCYNGNFHPETVCNYFIKNIEPYLEGKYNLCTWGLVEWRDDEKIIESIFQYEKSIDPYITQHGIFSVCAYDANRTNDKMINLLLKCHDYLLTDEEIKHLVN